MFQLYDFGQQGGDVEERAGARAGSLLVVVATVAVVLLGLAFVSLVTHALSYSIETIITTIYSTVIGPSETTIYETIETIIDTIYTTVTEVNATTTIQQ